MPILASAHASRHHRDYGKSWGNDSRNHEYHGNGYEQGKWPGDGDRDGHERDRDKEVEARDSTDHVERHQPLQQRAPDVDARSSERSDHKQCCEHQDQVVRDANDYERQCSPAPADDHEREIAARELQR